MLSATEAFRLRGTIVIFSAELDCISDTVINKTDKINKTCLTKHQHRTDVMTDAQIIK